VRQPLGYTLTVPQSVTLQLRSRNSKALKQEVYRKTAALAQDDQRDAALAVGRLGGGASDGAGPAGQLFIACASFQLRTTGSHRLQWSSVAGGCVGGMQVALKGSDW